MGECICEWPNGCAGLGVLICRGCGGDLCVCICNGEMDCDGCEDCDEFADDDDEISTDHGDLYDPECGSVTFDDDEL